MCFGRVMTPEDAHNQIPNSKLETHSAMLISVVHLLAKQAAKEALLSLSQPTPTEIEHAPTPQKPDDIEPLLTVKEVALLDRCSEKTVRRAIASGHLESFRVGPGARAIRITQSAHRRYRSGLMAWLSESKKVH